MNLIEVQDKLKGLSDQQLAQEMQMPSGSAPQYMVLSELQRRQDMRKRYEAAQAQAPQTTVAEDALASSGIPQGQVSQMARSMAPNSSIAQNTGIASLAQPPMQEEPQRMAGGGMVRHMYDGRGIAALPPAVLNDPAMRAMAVRMGKSIPEYLAGLDPTQAEALVNGSIARAKRDRMMALEPSDAFGGIKWVDDQAPGQFTPVNPSYREQTTSTFPDDTAGPEAGLAVEPQPLYDLSAFETLPTNIRPESDRQRPEPRPGALDNVTPFSLEDFAENYTTEWSDFTDPFRAWRQQPDETVRTYDYTTGKFVDVPTLGTQARNAIDAISEIPLPMLDADLGDPYSRLTPQELADLQSGVMSLEDADRIQSERMADSGPVGSGINFAAQPVDIPPAAPPQDASPEVTTPNAPVQTPGGNVITPADPATTTGIGALAGTGAGTGGTGGSGGVSAAAAPMSSYEQQIIDAMGRAEKRANQDKWLALAQAGMALMSSKEPTLMGALGEAGIAGLTGYKDVRDTAENTRLGLEKTLYDIQTARAMAAQRAAGASARQPSLSDAFGIIGQYNDAIAAIRPKDELLAPMSPEDAEMVRRLEEERNRYLSLVSPNRPIPVPGLPPQ